MQNAKRKMQKKKKKFTKQSTAYKSEAKHLYSYQRWWSKHVWIHRYSIKNESSVPERPYGAPEMSISLDIKNNLVDITLLGFLFSSDRKKETHGLEMIFRYLSFQLFFSRIFLEMFGGFFFRNENTKIHFIQ